MADLTEAEELELLELEEQERLSREAPVINERLPQVSVRDRAIVKNLVTNPEASFNFLQKKYPDLEFKKDKSGEIIARPRGSTEFRRLDPQGFDPEDLFDLGVDVAGGLAEFGATGVGAAAGPVGAVAAGAASAAGVEALKQKAAEALGVENAGDLSDVALSGALGGAGPLLFGAKGVKSPAAAALKKGATKLASFVSDIDEPILKAAYENLERIGTRGASREAAEIAESTSESFLEKASKLRRSRGEKLGKIYEGLNAKVDLSDVGEKAKALLEKYRVRAKEVGSDAAKKDFEFVTKNVLEFLPGGLGKEESAARALKIANSVNDLSGVRKGVESTGKDEAERDLLNFAKTIAKDINEKIEKATPQVKKMRGKYAQAATAEKDAKTLFGDAKAAERSLSSLFSPKQNVQKTAIEDLAEVLKIPDVKEKANLVAAIREFQNPTWFPRSRADVTSTAKALTLGAIGAGGAGYAGGDGVSTPALLGGAALGTLAGSPRGLKLLMQAAKKAPEMGDVPRAIYSQRGTWEQLLGGE